MLRLQKFLLHGNCSFVLSVCVCISAIDTLQSAMSRFGGWSKEVPPPARVTQRDAESSNPSETRSDASVCFQYLGLKSFSLIDPQNISLCQFTLSLNQFLHVITCLWFSCEALYNYFLTLEWVLGAKEVLLVIGGFGSQQSPIDVVEKYDPKTREWSFLPVSYVVHW